MRSLRSRVAPALQRIAALRSGLALALLYYLGCATSALMVHGAQGFALFWPAAGVGLAWLVRFGLRDAWGIPLALLAYYGTFSTLPGHFLPASILANTAGTVAGAWIARGHVHDARIDVRSGMWVLFGGLVLALIGGTVGAAASALAGLGGPADRNALWLHWVLGNLLGVAAAGPALMLATRRTRAPPLRDDPREPEHLAWLVALVASYVLLAWGATAGGRYVLGLLSLPLVALTWSALRLRLVWTAFGTLATSLLIGFFTGFNLVGFKVPTRAIDVAQLLGFLVVTAVLPIVVAVATHERRVAARRLLHTATTDPITDLPNRTAFEQAARASLAAPATPPRAFAYIDLDHLKLVNDTASHAAGDALIRGVGGVLRTGLQPGDLLGHLGGDEFAVLLHNVLPAAAEERARRMLRDIGGYRSEWNGRQFGTTASIGLVAFQDEGAEFAQLLSQADAACFAAKDAGGDQVSRASLADGEFDHTRDMRSALRARDAVEQRRLALYAQAIVPFNAGETGRHFEVLLRLRDPETGELMHPAEFFAAAGRFRLGVMIDREVVQMGLDWLERHADPHEVELCSLNLSAEALGDEGFLAFIGDRLRRTTFPTDKLCFEITETSALRDIARAQRFIAQMRALGCRFALDDFGTGFSSFGYVQSLDVDYFKIDGSFVRDLGTSPLSLPIVRAITDIAHTLDRYSIAEHAETPAQLATLAELGVDMAQGFGLHRPEPIEHYFARTLPATVQIGRARAP